MLVCVCVCVCVCVFVCVCIHIYMCAHERVLYVYAFRRSLERVEWIS